MIGATTLVLSSDDVINKGSPVIEVSERHPFAALCAMKVVVALHVGRCSSQSFSVIPNARPVFACDS